MTSLGLATSPSAALTPVASQQRLATLDILRGFALIGILLMNIEWFSRPSIELGMLERNLVGADFITAWLVKVLVEGKFYKLFSLLFGMGFAVMLLRAQSHDRPFARLFSRRMLALFLFGLLHASLLWLGDILQAYAMGGMCLLGWMLLASRPRWPTLATPAFQLKLSLGLMVLPFLLMLGVGSVYVLSRDTQQMTQEWQERLQVEPLAEQMLADAKRDGRDLLADHADTTTAEEPTATLAPAQRLTQLAAERARDKAELQQSTQAEIAALTQPHFSVAVAFRAKQAIGELPFVVIMALFDLFPIFLFGYWLIITGRMRQPELHLPWFRALAGVGLLLGLVLSVGSVAIQYHPASRHVVIVGNAAGALFQVGQYVLAAGYLGLLVLLLQRPFWQRVTRSLAAMGRLALTHYLTHSLVLSLLFNGYGLGWYGQLSRAEQLWLVLAILLAQALLSPLWLRYFRFGPMEWLWRCITYWQWQPFRVSATISATTSATTSTNKPAPALVPMTESVLAGAATTVVELAPRSDSTTV